MKLFIRSAEDAQSMCLCCKEKQRIAEGRRKGTKNPHLTWVDGNNETRDCPGNERPTHPKLDVFPFSGLKGKQERKKKKGHVEHSDNNEGSSSSPSKKRAHVEEQEGALSSPVKKKRKAAHDPPKSQQEIDREVLSKKANLGAWNEEGLYIFKHSILDEVKDAKDAKAAITKLEKDLAFIAVRRYVDRKPDSRVYVHAGRPTLLNPMKPTLDDSLLDGSQVVVWSPEDEFGIVMQCPQPECRGSTTRKDWNCTRNSKMASRLGTNQLNLFSLITSPQYVCNNRCCGHKFDASDQEALNLMPQCVQSAFPAFLPCSKSELNSIDKPLILSLEGAAKTGGSVATFAALLREQKCTIFDLLLLHWLIDVDFVLQCQEAGLMQGLLTIENILLPSSPFDERLLLLKKECESRIPTDQSFSKMLQDTLAEQSDFFRYTATDHLKKLTEKPTVILCLDHTFKMGADGKLNASDPTEVKFHVMDSSDGSLLFEKSVTDTKLASYSEGLTALCGVLKVECVYIDNYPREGGHVEGGYIARLKEITGCEMIKQDIYHVLQGCLDPTDKTNPDTKSFRKELSGVFLKSDQETVDKIVGKIFSGDFPKNAHCYASQDQGGALAGSREALFLSKCHASRGPATRARIASNLFQTSGDSPVFAELQDWITTGDISDNLQSGVKVSDKFMKVFDDNIKKSTCKNESEFKQQVELVYSRYCQFVSLHCSLSDIWTSTSKPQIRAPRPSA
mmetsp:Transcript_17433/g.34181  ORF Transcript_17433/g.34181 Transcript_17433/m.34181 type:complete len:734 (+) Transcript_17433:412-2613(+)